jgi:hypothetical protein
VLSLNKQIVIFHHSSRLVRIPSLIAHISFEGVLFSVISLFGMSFVTGVSLLSCFPHQTNKIEIHNKADIVNNFFIFGIIIKNKNSDFNLIIF